MTTSPLFTVPELELDELEEELELLLDELELLEEELELDEFGVCDPPQDASTKVRAANAAPFLYLWMPNPILPLIIFSSF
jgi:hypothetical protein